MGHPHSNSLWPISSQILCLSQHTSLPPPLIWDPNRNTLYSPFCTLLFSLNTSWKQLLTGTIGPMSFFSMLWFMPGVGKLQLVGQIWPAAYFCKYLNGSQHVHLFTYVYICELHMWGTSELQRQSWEAAAETIWSEKSEIFTILLFIGNVCCPWCMPVYGYNKMYLTCSLLMNSHSLKFLKNKL